MKHGLICQLARRDEEMVLVLLDATKAGDNYQKGNIFTELPEWIETALHNKELIAQLGENILIRLAASNGIDI